MPPKVSAMLAIVLGLLPVFYVGAAYVLIAHDVPMTRQDLGNLTAQFFGLSVVMALAGRRIARVLHHSTSLRIGVLLTAASLTTLGVAASLTTIVAAMGLAGAANGLIQPASSVGFSIASSDGRLGLAFGLQQTAVPAATAIAGFSIPLLSTVVGWSTGALLLAAIVGVTALLGDFGKSATVAVTGGTTSPRRPERPVDGRPMILLALGISFAGAAASVIGSFLVDGLVSKGLSAALAASLLGAGSVVAITVRLAAGLLFDASLSIARQGLTGFLMAASGAFVLLSRASSPTALAMASILVFSTALGWAGLFHAHVVTNARDVARAVSMAHSGTFLGAFVGPIAFGAIVERLGYDRAWLHAAGWCLLSAITVMLVGRGPPAPVSPVAGPDLQ